jgi:hypothetical protein
MSDKQKKYGGIEFFQATENSPEKFADKCSELLSKNYIFTSPVSVFMDKSGTAFFTQQWLRKDGEKVVFDVVPDTKA